MVEQVEPISCHALMRVPRPHNGLQIRGVPVCTDRSYILEFYRNRQADMQSFYFFAMVIGVVWLAIWSSLPKPYDGKGWWPFTWSPFDVHPDPQSEENGRLTAPTYLEMRRRSAAPPASLRGPTNQGTALASDPVDAALGWRHRAQHKGAEWTYRREV